jgi:hypothetical protein
LDSGWHDRAGIDKCQCGGGKPDARKNLAGLSNPPEDFGYDTPAIDGNRSGLIFAVFWHQNFGVIKALQAGNN